MPNLRGFLYSCPKNAAERDINSNFCTLLILTIVKNIHFYIKNWGINSSNVKKIPRL